MKFNKNYLILVLVLSICLIPFVASTIITERELNSISLTGSYNNDSRGLNFTTPNNALSSTYIYAEYFKCCSTGSCTANNICQRIYEYLPDGNKTLIIQSCSNVSFTGCGSTDYANISFIVELKPSNTYYYESSNYYQNGDKFYLAQYSQKLYGLVSNAGYLNGYATTDLVKITIDTIGSILSLILLFSVVITFVLLFKWINRKR